MHHCHHFLLWCLFSNEWGILWKTDYFWHTLYIKQAENMARSIRIFGGKYQDALFRHTVLRVISFRMKRLHLNFQQRKQSQVGLSCSLHSTTCLHVQLLLLLLMKNIAKSTKRKWYWFWFWRSATQDLHRKQTRPMLWSGICVRLDKLSLGVSELWH